LSENKSLTRKKGKRGTKDDGNGISFHVTESSQRQEEKTTGEKSNINEDNTVGMMMMNIIGPMEQGGCSAVPVAAWQAA